MRASKIPSQLLAPGPLSVVLLAIALATSSLAWAVQAGAAADARAAIEAQERAVPESDASAPDLDDYHRILETLDRSIAIRQSVDAELGRVERLVESLSGRQADAGALTQRARTILQDIARSLDSSAAAAAASSGELDGLRGGLLRSAQLSAAIAEELEELDRSMGPTVGRDGP